MSRYFFHTQDGHAFTDRDGTELTSTAAARLEAFRLHGQLLREMPPNEVSLCITVTDDRGLVLFRIETVLTEAPAIVQPPRL